ncbi:MAG TPA: AarF/UbiB family protein [Polyangiaceae bacterium]|nr:AarF/UbiB family protein [Polyangiaceae bacterium]
MGRSLRALFLALTILASYGLHYVVATVFGWKRTAARFERVHAVNAKRLATGCTELRGVFIKLGQVLSVLGGFLPRAYGRELERLQDRVPPRPFPEIEGRLKEALGPDALARFASFSREPIAAASLAQVHRATTMDGRSVAVKVLYPGIETLIQRDLAVLRTLLPVFRRLLPISRFDRILDQLSAMLARETDYSQERRNIETVRAIFSDRSDVVVPTVVSELTAGGVLTMTFEDGIKVTDFASIDAAGIDRDAVARLLVEIYWAMLLEHRVFHADPHPGNFLVRPGPTLVMLDYGAVEECTPALAEGMMDVVLGGVSRDAERVLAGLERMGFVAPSGDREMLQRVGREYLKVIANVRIDDYSQIDRDAVEKIAGFEGIRGKLREIMTNIEYPEGYFYVERTIVLLFGLVGQLAPKAGLPGIAGPVAAQAMLRSFAAQAAAAPGPESEAPASA